MQISIKYSSLKKQLAMSISWQKWRHEREFAARKTEISILRTVLLHFSAFSAYDLKFARNFFYKKSFSKLYKRERCFCSPTRIILRLKNGPIAYKFSKLVRRTAANLKKKQQQKSAILFFNLFPTYHLRREYALVSRRDSPPNVRHRRQSANDRLRRLSSTTPT